MTIARFDKPHLSASELLDKLATSGMHIPDRAVALHYMEHVGGYRLKGYWMHLRPQSGGTLEAGTTFDAVIQRYEFDRALRRVFFEALEQLEVSVRARMSNYLSGAEGPHWFLKDELFQLRQDRKDPTKGLQNEVRTRVERDVAQASERPYVAHYKERYSDPPIPPSWTTSECLSFGIWSRAFRDLMNSQHQMAIATMFNVPNSKTFGSWLHTLSVLRNTVAHHGRLWRIRSDVAPLDYHQKKIRFGNTSRTLYAASTVINYLLDNCSLTNQWAHNLDSVMKQFPTIDRAEIGFPDNWSTLPGWNRQDNRKPPKPPTSPDFAAPASTNRRNRRREQRQHEPQGAMAAAFAAAKTS